MHHAVKHGLTNLAQTASQVAVKVGEVDTSAPSPVNPNMEKFALMGVISALFVAIWIFVGLAVALYVRAQTEDENLKNSHAT